MKQQLFKFDEGESEVFFTSDTHFGHEKIISLCNRPFFSVEEMDNTLIENWNSVIGPNDYVFHLGDFCFKGNQYWGKILDQLNGHKFLILGNHDSRALDFASMTKFDWVGNQVQIMVGDRSVYLNHYPFLCYGGVYRSPENAVWQLYGHVHSGSKSLGRDMCRLKYVFPTQYDVGVDNNNYTPISFREISTKIKEQCEVISGDCIDA